MNPRMLRHDLRIRHALWLVPSLLLLVATGGCLEREGVPVTPCTQSTTGRAIQVENVEQVDVLFMVDNSNSMDDEQIALQREFPTLVNILATGDFNQNDSLEDPEDFRPVRDLNVAVVTSDMGAGGFGGIASCARADVGDDGIFQRDGNQVEEPSCMAEYPPFLNFQPSAPDANADQFSFDFGCLALQGVGGCGFEQQLEALLKAASPRNATSWTAANYTSPDFLFGEGHGDIENAGFFRDNSVLALVLISDEDDCSARDRDIYNPATVAYGGVNVNLRCSTFEEEALQPVGRYANGYLQLRRTPGQLIYAPIVGIPQDLAPPATQEGPIDFGRILADRRMENRDQQVMGEARLVPSCTSALGEAFPPRRIVRVAQELQTAGAGVTVQSICNNTFREALRAIIRIIADALGQACLPRPLARDADREVPCNVFVRLAPDDTGGCEAVPGWDSSTTPEVIDDQTVCQLRQLVPAPEEIQNNRAPSGEGWYYDDYTNEGEMNCDTGPDGGFQRIAFTADIPNRATVQLECLQAVVGGQGTTVELGQACEPTQADPCLNAESGLLCDDVVRECGVQCVDDSNCRSAGLVGFVCDRRPRCEAAPETLGSGDPMDPCAGASEANLAPHNFCVNPTCGE